MFADAIELTSKFTRPIQFIMRNYKSKDVIPGTATFFFINDDGVAITCKHVVEELLRCTQICETYKKFKGDVAAVQNNGQQKANIKRIEQRYGFHSKITIQSKSLFYCCAEVEGGSISFNTISHPDYDLAIIKINNAKSYQYSGHAVFAKNSSSLRRGDFLCRIGYPFPEFSNYVYNPENDDIEWTDGGRQCTPLFPIEGMYTRNVCVNGTPYAYELSTPGLKGQSGGPLFNVDGIVFGMQSETQHLHLGFDMINTSFPIAGKMEKVNNQPFLHVGNCINVDVIKNFLDVNHIKYYIGDSMENVEVVNG